MAIILEALCQMVDEKRILRRVLIPVVNIIENPQSTIVVGVQNHNIKACDQIKLYIRACKSIINVVVKSLTINVNLLFFSFSKRGADPRQFHFNFIHTFSTCSCKRGISMVKKLAGSGDTLVGLMRPFLRMDRQKRYNYASEMLSCRSRCMISVLRPPKTVPPHTFVASKR